MLDTLIDIVIKGFGLLGAGLFFVAIISRYWLFGAAGLTISACVLVGGLIAGDYVLVVTEIFTLAVATVGSIAMTIISDTYASDQTKRNAVYASLVMGGGLAVAAYVIVERLNG
jgi:hypothetical protein